MIPLLALAVCADFAGATLDLRAEGDRIRAARDRIAREGLSWQAGSTSVSKLSEDELAWFLGLDLDLRETAPGEVDSQVPPEDAGSGPRPMSVPGLPPQPQGGFMIAPPPEGDHPARWDWREHEGVTGVRDQEMCGDCWNFAATAAFESYVLIYDDQEYDLSEQDVLNCNPYGYGCSGGWMTAAYKHFMRSGALAESCIPYEADDSGACVDRGCDVLDYLSGWHDVLPTVPDMKRALLQGPIAVAMTVHEDFLCYTGGCYEYDGNGTPNHAILLIGWDDTMADGAGAWIGKNSWGTNWGEDGFFFIRFNQCEVGYGATEIEYSPRTGIVINHTPLAEQPIAVESYPITTRVVSQAGLLDHDSLLLCYSVDGVSYSSTPLIATPEMDVFAASIPAAVPGTTIQYYIEAADLTGRVQTAPVRAPAQSYRFRCGYQVLYAFDGETPDPAWAHAAIEPGFGDQWHRSELRNHTPDGDWSWRLGPVADADYADLLDAGLVTPQIALTPDCELRYWQWIEAEHSPFHMGWAYDGGLVEISVDDGASWEILTPEGGYPYTTRVGMVPGPFPYGTQLFSGGVEWREITFDLSDYGGPAHLRFHFGSDGAINFGGWHIDDVRLLDFTGDGSLADIALHDFCARWSDDGVDLNWTLAESHPWIGFVVERGLETVGEFMNCHIEMIGRTGVSDPLQPGVEQHCFTDEPPEHLTSCYYRLVGFGPDDTREVLGTILATRQTDAGEQPVRPQLRANAPNPVRSRTTLRFYVPQTADGLPVTLSIFDSTGRLRAQPLSARRMPSGEHAWEWDRDRGGETGLEAGSYYARLEVGDWVTTRPMLLLPH